MSSNSSWINYEDQKPPDGSTALVYLDRECGHSRIAVYTSKKISNGYTAIINGIFYFDVPAKILYWKPIEEVLADLPLDMGD